MTITAPPRESSFPHPPTIRRWPHGNDQSSRKILARASGCRAGKARRTWSLFGGRYGRPFMTETSSRPNWRDPISVKKSGRVGGGVRPSRPGRRTVACAKAATRSAVGSFEQFRYQALPTTVGMDQGISHVIVAQQGLRAVPGRCWSARNSHTRQARGEWFNLPPAARGPGGGLTSSTP